MAINIGALFSYGLEATGEAFAERDASVKASAQASAEAFAKKREKYDDEITVNRNMLKKNAEAIRNSLGINEVGKIRTIISTYGAEDTMAELQKDFTNYQKGTILKSNDGKFKTLSDYVKGRISGTSNTFLNDAEAEQAADEAAVIGDELDIQKATDRAKAEGVTLEQYLNNKARSMSNRPSFDIDTRAAQLVKESKLGLFGGELTLEEAKSQILGDNTMGDSAKDLGSTGFALSREGGLSAEQQIKINAMKEAADSKSGKLQSSADLSTQRNDIAKMLVEKKYAVKTGAGTFQMINKPSAWTAALSEIDTRLTNKTLDPKSIAVLEKLKEEFQIRLSKPKDEKIVGSDEKIVINKRKNNNRDVVSIKNVPKNTNEANKLIKQLEDLKGQGHIYFLNNNNKLVFIDKNISALKDTLTVKQPKVKTNNPLGVTPNTKISSLPKA